MGFEIDLSDVDPQSIGQSNFAKPGWYHLRIDNATEFTEYLEFACTIVGTVPGNESEFGKKIKERVYNSGAFPKVAASILVATGVLTSGDLQELKEAGKSANLQLEEMIGKSFVGHYKEEEYEKKDGSGKSKITKIGFGWYHPGSESAKNSKVQLNDAVITSATNNEFDPFA